jgi:DNA-binding winged helix-turn-helix (wHTH) protein
MLTFAGCTLDLAGRVLLRDGRPEHLEPQAFDVLVHLVQHRGRVVAQEELLDAVWGGRWITASALTTRIKEIRRATGDDGGTQAVVRTVRGRGYQLVAAVTDDAPGRPSQLIGRDRDLDELDARIRPGAVVTLVGPGGVGKTSLGRLAAARAAARFSAGAVTVDLTVLEDPSQLIGAVARAADVVGPDDAGLVEALSRLDVVMLLDDADDFVADVANLCDALRTRTSSMAIVVTSRERLGARGEQLWPVLPLAAQAARELLLARWVAFAPPASPSSTRSPSPSTASRWRWRCWPGCPACSASPSSTKSSAAALTSSPRCSGRPPSGTARSAGSSRLP